MDSKRIVTVSGIRRCAKSDLIRQQYMKSGIATYIDFNDPRLVGYELVNFTRLEQLMIDKMKSILIVDEVQIIPNLEIYARIANKLGAPLYH